MLISGHRHKGRDLEPGGFKLCQDAGVDVINRHDQCRNVGIIRLLDADNLAQRFNGGDQAGAGGYLQFFHSANSQTVKDEAVPQGTVMR